jgi:hypothetical protein
LVFLKPTTQFIVTDPLQSNYTLIFHCFLALLKRAPLFILLGVFLCLYVHVVLMIFNEVKGSNPLKVELKTMKIIVKKRIEFFIISLRVVYDAAISSIESHY